MSASLTHHCPSNSLRSNYQKNACKKRIVCIYREKKNIAYKKSISELIQATDSIINFYLDHPVYLINNMHSSQFQINAFIE